MVTGQNYRHTIPLLIGVTQIGMVPILLYMECYTDENTPIDKQVKFQYELDTLTLHVGKHVKVTSADTGGWKLFMKTATGLTNVGTENGTIRLSLNL